MIIPLAYLGGAFFLSYKKPHIGLFCIFFHYIIMMWVGFRFPSIDHRLMGTVGTALLYLVVFSNFKIIPRNLKFLKFYLFFNIVFFLHLTFLSIYHSADITLYLDFFKNYFHYFLLILLTFSVLSVNLDYKFLKLFTVLIVIEAILILGQLSFPVVHQMLVIQSISTDGGLQAIVSEKIAEGNLAVGTIMRPAQLGNFLAVLIPSAYFIGHRKYVGRKKFFLYSILFLLFFILLNTGIRTSIVSFTFFLLCVLFFTNKKHFWVISISGFALLILNFTILKNLGANYDSSESFDNPIGRLAGGLLKLQEEEYVTEESTLSRTYNILKQIDNVVMGNSIYIKGGRYNGVESPSDAQLSFLLVEFGVITLILCMIPFLYPLFLLYRRSRNRPASFRFALAFFVSVILQMITDQGFFTVLTSATYFVVLSYLLFKQNQQRLPVHNSSYSYI